MMMLEVTNLQVAYGLSQVLFGISFRARAGEIVALLGRNGAGKSTTLKAIMGLLPIREGRIHLRGQEVTGQPPYLLNQRGIGYVPEDRRIFHGLTVRENLLVGALPERRRPKGQHQAGWDFERVFELFPLLSGLVDRKAGTLSGGEQQMLSIARTLMGNPEVLLLDEPTEGLAPKMVHALEAQIAKLRDAGLTIVLSEQRVKFAVRLASQAYLLERGRIVFHGDAAELMANEAVRRAHLMV